ncbi:MAG: hypothetical protein AAF628_10715 [Planctomycetota bacterium]
MLHSRLHGRRATRRAAWSCLLLASVGVVAASAPSQQSPPPELQRRAADLHAVTGLNDVRGTPMAVGPGYLAAFRGAALDLQLARADQPVGHLELELRDVRRGGAALPLAEPTVHYDDRRLEYRRGALTERYAVQTAGVEQSFTLTRLPAGAGDLVVRLTLTTDLALVEHSADGVTFDGARIGAVTAIDAAGARVAGSLRLEGNTLELRVPSRFVDRAALPLLIDPLIGPTASFASPFRDQEYDLAYDETEDLYLVVWRREPAGGGPTSYHGQRIGADGSFVGSGITFGTATSSPEIRVVNVNGADSFVVGVGQQLGLVTVDAATGSLSPWAQSFGMWNWSLAGDARPTGTRAIFVDNASALSSVLWALDVQAGQAPLVARAKIEPGSLGIRTALASTGGADGRYLVAQTNGALRVIDEDLNVLDTRQVPGLVFGAEHLVDGDGERWVIADETAGGDIWARSLSWDRLVGQLQVGPEIVLTSSATGEEVDTVAWAGASALIGYRRANGAYLGSVDPVACADCEGEFLLTEGLRGPFDPVAVGTPFSGSLTGGPTALVILEHPEPRQTLIARFRIEDGAVQDLGGGCGAGGDASATCARYDNGLFYHRLAHTTPAAPVALILGAVATPIACGPCRLWPSLTGGAVIATASSPTGTAQVLTPLPGNPALIGGTLFDQWATLRPGGACRFGDIDLSNALSVTIE